MSKTKSAHRKKQAIIDRHERFVAVYTTDRRTIQFAKTEEIFVLCDGWNDCPVFVTREAGTLRSGQWFLIAVKNGHHDLALASEVSGASTIGLRSF